METTHKNKSSYILTNHELFDSVKKRVNADHAGCNVLVPHVCNNIDLFGAGFAQSVADRYPSVKADYHMLGKTFLKNNLGHSQFLKVYEEPKYKHKLYFINMIAQNSIRSATNIRPLNYAALTRCMVQLVQFINQNKSEQFEIHAPKFGSGLAGGNWSFISCLIDDIWSKQTVFIYDYNKKKHL